MVLTYLCMGKGCYILRFLFMHNIITCNLLFYSFIFFRQNSQYITNKIFYILSRGWNIIVFSRHNMLFSFSKGLSSFKEGSADHMNTEIGVALLDSTSQEAAECVETLDTTWSEALPFVPGQRYHSDGKFLS